MNRLCIIIPYYGRWPSYFNIYLHSCINNNFIDFIFFTDLETPSVYPPNVKFHHISLEHLNNLISSKLEVIIKITNPYKLCDFKPLYGFIFDDFINDYVFWGYGDIDLIYGNIKDFVSEDLLNANDVISFRKDWISGCLSIFRNLDNVNNLFWESKNINKVISSEEYLGFDECSKLWSKIRTHDILEIDETQSITYLVKKAVKEGKLRAHFKNEIKESIEHGTVLSYKDERILNNTTGQEYLIYHYITEKRNASFYYPNWKVIPDKFYITRTGFYLEDEFLSLNFYLIYAKRRFVGFLRYLLKIPPRIIKKVFFL